MSGDVEDSFSSFIDGRGAGGGTAGVVVGAPLTTWLRRVSEGMLPVGGELACIRVVPWTKDSVVGEGGVGSIRWQDYQSMERDCLSVRVIFRYAGHRSRERGVSRLRFADSARK